MDQKVLEEQGFSLTKTLGNSNVILAFVYAELRTPENPNMWTVIRFLPGHDLLLELFTAPNKKNGQGAPET